MIIHAHQSRRRGGAALQFAITAPVLLLITLGTSVLGLGVSRYQLVAELAREGARYASVHGSQYASVTGNAAATASTVYANAIAPKNVMLAPSNLTYSVTWTPNNNPGSKVTVTVTYLWVPEAYLGSMNLSSTSVMTMVY